MNSLSSRNIIFSLKKHKKVKCCSSTILLSALWVKTDNVFILKSNNCCFLTDKTSVCIFLEITSFKNFDCPQFIIHSSLKKNGSDDDDLVFNPFNII